MATRPALKDRFNFPPEDPAYVAKLRQRGEETRRITEAINARFPGGPEQYRAERAAGLIKER